MSFASDFTDVKTIDPLSVTLGCCAGGGDCIPSFSIIQSGPESARSSCVAAVSRRYASGIEEEVLVAVG